MSREDKYRRIERLASEGKIQTESEKKKFKLPYKFKVKLKTGNKKDNVIPVMYLTRKYTVRFHLCNVIAGNLVVIDNRVHELNPKTIWRIGKHTLYIIREIDRKPVSNLDYNKVRTRHDDTESDVPLIKAVLGAVQKPSPLQNKSAIIIIIVIIAVALGVLFFMNS